MTDTKVSDILSAIADWNEATQELEQMQSEYTGYSPGYHLASWYEAEEKAEERFMAALDAYVDEKIKAALEKR